MLFLWFVCFIIRYYSEVSPHCPDQWKQIFFLCTDTSSLKLLSVDMWALTQKWWYWSIVKDRQRQAVVLSVCKGLLCSRPLWILCLFNLTLRCCQAAARGGMSATTPQTGRLGLCTLLSLCCSYVRDFIYYYYYFASCITVPVILCLFPQTWIRRRLCCISRLGGVCSGLRTSCCGSLERERPCKWPTDKATPRPPLLLYGDTSVSMSSSQSKDQTDFNMEKKEKKTIIMTLFE